MRLCVPEMDALLDRSLPCLARYSRSDRSGRAEHERVAQEEEDTMSKIIAYCGLVCSDCAAYAATQSNDPAALERVAAQWREEFSSPEITAELDPL